MRAGAAYALSIGVFMACCTLAMLRCMPADGRAYCYRPELGQLYYTTNGQQPCPRTVTIEKPYCPAP